MILVLCGVLDMTAAEKQILSMYLANEGVRLDMAVDDAQRLFQLQWSRLRLMQLNEAIIRKECFDKFSHDLCALLNIFS